jgi:hypothetical protein
MAKRVPVAAREQRELQVKRDKGKTTIRERTPTLAEFVDRYIDRLYS